MKPFDATAKKDVSVNKLIWIEGGWYFGVFLNAVLLKMLQNISSNLSLSLAKEFCIRFSRLCVLPSIAFMGSKAEAACISESLWAAALRYSWWLAGLVKKLGLRAGWWCGSPANKDSDWLAVNPGTPDTAETAEAACAEAAEAILTTELLVGGNLERQVQIEE